jgi:cell division protease FtsH
MILGERYVRCRRREVLGTAIPRPGWFDRQLVADEPALEGCEAVLKLHGHGKSLALEIDKQVAIDYW